MKEVIATTADADEAQAMILGSTMERGVIKDGHVIRLTRIVVPEEYYQTVQGAVIEQLFFARDKVLDEYPTLAANVLADRLVRDKTIRREDAKSVRNQIEHEIKGGIERLVSDAQGRYSARMPIVLQSLIPLIKGEAAP